MPFKDVTRAMSPESRAIWTNSEAEREAISAQKSALIGRIRVANNEIQATKTRIDEIERAVSEKGRSHDASSRAELKTHKSDLADLEELKATLIEQQNTKINSTANGASMVNVYEDNIGKRFEARPLPAVTVSKGRSLEDMVEAGRDDVAAAKAYHKKLKAAKLSKGQAKILFDRQIDTLADSGTIDVRPLRTVMVRYGAPRDLEVPGKAILPTVRKTAVSESRDGVLLPYTEEQTDFGALFASVFRDALKAHGHKLIDALPDAENEIDLSERPKLIAEAEAAIFEAELVEEAIIRKLEAKTKKPFQRRMDANPLATFALRIVNRPRGVAKADVDVEYPRDNGFDNSDAA